MSLIPLKGRAPNNLPVNMSFLAKISDLAYEPSSVIRQQLTKMGIGYDIDFEFFEGARNATQGFLLGDTKNIVICFRGTEPIKLNDWLTDLDFAQVSISTENNLYEVHGGFWQGLENVWPHISGWLNNKTSGRKIWLAGHSLGGALASLALVRFVQMDLLNQVEGLYTYGCPRSVNRDLAESMNEHCKEKIFRMVNDEDIVPHVPPDDKYIDAMDFSHFGTRVFFSQNEDVWINDKQELWGASKTKKRHLISSIINKVFDAANVIEKISDHSRKNYCRLSCMYESKQAGSQ